MSNKKDHRARNAVKKLNEIRHKQDKKIDILCNDMVSAHRDFIVQLKAANFSVSFYESILGTTDLRTLMNTATVFIGDNIPGSTVAAFLLDGETFHLYVADDNCPIEVDKPRLENSFTQDVVTKICKANSVSSLDDMLHMGLSTDLNGLGQISAAAIPFGRFGKGIGFILICCDTNNALTAERLQMLRSITKGLYKAISSARQAAQTTDI